MKVTIIPIVIGAFGTVTKGLLKELEDLEVGGRVVTIQTIALLRTARILRKALETWGDLLSLKLQWKTITIICKFNLIPRMPIFGGLGSYPSARDSQCILNPSDRTGNRSKAKGNSELDGLVWFDGISTIVGYIMPNPIYTCIRYIWFVNIS